MGNETVAIAKTANKATATGEPSYDGIYSRLWLRESSDCSISETLNIFMPTPLRTVQLNLKIN